MTKPLNLLILDLNQEAGLVHRRKWSNPARVDWIVAKQTSFTVLRSESGLGFLSFFFFALKYHLQQIIFVPLFFVIFCFDMAIVALCSPSPFQFFYHCIVWYALIKRKPQWNNGDSFWEFVGLLMLFWGLCSEIAWYLYSVLSYIFRPIPRHHVLTVCSSIHTLS